MFTFFVRLWLIGVLSVATALFLQALYLTLRDGRRSRRQMRAHFYAQLIVMDRVKKGEFDGKTPQDIQDAYEFEKIAYLNS